MGQKVVLTLWFYSKVQWETKMAQCLEVLHMVEPESLAAICYPSISRQRKKH